MGDIGGIAVFIGLLLEKFAEWMDGRFLGGSYKPHKTLESIGWSILMLGIFAEIAVAAWSANDAWQTRQMAIKNDPLNQPITYLAAVVSLDVHGTNFSDFDPSESFNQHFSNLFVGEYDLTKKGLWMMRLECKSCESHLGQNDGRWYLVYGFSRIGPFWNITTNDTAKVVDKLDTIALQAPYLRPNNEIMGGEIILMVNQQIKHFPISHRMAGATIGQWPPWPPAPSNGVSVSVTCWP